MYLHCEVEKWPFPSHSDPRFASGTGQVGSKGKVIMVLPTRSDSRDVLKLCDPPLCWVLGNPHLPVLWEIFIARLGDQLPGDLGLRDSESDHELLELGL